MSSSYLVGKCSMPPSPHSKRTTSTCSHDVTACPPAGVARAGVGVALALAALRAYKLALSPFFAGACRFTPSCSDYMADAIRIYGVTGGVWRGIRRLARCRPFGGYGLDPVPRP